MKLIEETAWYHEGDYKFMKNLVTEILSKTETELVKLYITLNFDEYMSSSKANRYNFYTASIND